MVFILYVCLKSIFQNNFHKVYINLNSTDGMKETELLRVLIAILTLSLVIGFKEIISYDLNAFGTSILFAFIILGANFLGKKLMARALDSDVEDEIWKFQRFGFNQKNKFRKPIYAGIIFPIFLSIISLGNIMLMTITTYSTTSLKRRASRRFSQFSFTEMTEYHNGLIGAAGIISVLLISFLSYWVPGIDHLAKLAAFYAFFNMVPFSKLDGSQIYFGSRVLWATLAIITLIFTSYALLL